MIILDIETTGLNPERNGLLSIGAIDFTNPSERFYGECRIRRGEVVDPYALEINGFDKDEATSPAKQSTKNLLLEFKDWLDQRQIRVIGGLHIAAFDVPFLLAKAELCSVQLTLHKRSIDLHSIAYGKMLQLKRVIPLTDGWSVMDTDQIYPLCGLPPEPKPHHSLKGAIWEAEALSRLIYGKTLLREFARHPVPKHLL